MPRPARPTSAEILSDIDAQFNLDDEALHTITRKFLEDFNAGLSEYGHPMAMIPTFVTGVPDGTETGTFLALDLGGTNLRVCEVQLHGDQTFTLRQQKYKVSTALKTGEARALFDYLADSVDAFLTDSGYDFPDADAGDAAPISLGFTFSFPVEQTALDSGKILTWTKGFSARNAIGNDVVRLLQDSFDRKHMHVKCVALVNDTVGALLSRAYTAGGCLLGAIFGTGTNGAYVEDVAKITKLGNNDAVSRGGKMIVNCEWGAFNNSRTTLPTTIWDNKLDRESINPRFQAFEKFISGMYLGEISRNVLLSLVDSAPSSLLFGGSSSKVLNTHYGVDTAVMSAIEEAWEAPPADANNQCEPEGDKTRTESTEGVHVGAEPIQPETSASGVTTTASAKTTTSAANAPPSAPPITRWFESGFDEKRDVDEAVRARLANVRGVLVKELALAEEEVTLRDAAVVHWVCRLVAGRAAKLSGCAVAAVAVQTGHARLGADANHSFDAKTGKVAVGVDGSLIQFYPNFEAHLRESLRALVGPEVEKATEIGMAKDGSGVGAALCALQASKQAQKSSDSAKDPTKPSAL